MHKSAVILIILFFFSLLVSQVPQWPEWPAWPNWLIKSGPGLVSDTSPPDTFTTSPTIAYAPTDSFTVTWRQSEIDSPDVKYLRIAIYNKYYGVLVPAWANNKSLTIPWTTASVDSDTTVNFMAAFTWNPLEGYTYTNPDYYIFDYSIGDTLDTLFVIYTLEDSSSNSIVMDTIEYSFSVNYENGVSIDSLWYDVPSTCLYFRTLPTSHIKLNTTIPDSVVWFTFYAFRIINGNLTLPEWGSWHVDTTSSGMLADWGYNLDQLQVDSTQYLPFLETIPNDGDSIVIHQVVELYFLNRLHHTTKMIYGLCSDTLLIGAGEGADETPPNITGTVVLTIDSSLFVLDINETSVASDSGDIQDFLFYYKHQYDEFWTLLLTDITPNDTSFSLTISPGKGDTTFLKVAARDTNANITADVDCLLDTVAHSSSPIEVYFTTDTSRSVLSGVYLCREPIDSSGATTPDSIYFAMVNIDTTATDTLKLPLLATNNYAIGAWYWIRPYILAYDTVYAKSNSKWYPAPTLPSSMVVTAADSAGTDTVKYQITHFATENSFLPDSMRLQANLGATNSYPTSRTDGSNVFSIAFDSTAVNDDYSVTINVTPPDTVYFSLFVHRNGEWNESSKNDTAYYKSSGAAGGTCQSGTYLSAWDGDYDTDQDTTLCYNSGAGTKVGTVTNSVLISTTYGEGAPDIGAQLGGSDDYIEWAVSTDDLINSDSITIWMRFYGERPLGTETAIWECYIDGENYMFFSIDDGDSGLRASWRGQDTPDVAEHTTKLDLNTWLDIAVSWRVHVDDDIAINVGDSWEEADDDNVAHVGSITDMRLGNLDGISGTTVTRVSKFQIISGYKKAKPW